VTGNSKNEVNFYWVLPNSSFQWFAKETFNPLMLGGGQPVFEACLNFWIKAQEEARREETP